MSTRSSLHPSKTSRDNGPLANDADHLSNLHISVLSNILTQLPTKDVVRTSVLSKYWKDKWSCMNHVDIRDFESGVLYDNQSFCNFVDKTVFFQQNLSSFHRSCRGIYNFSRVREWILKVMRSESIVTAELELLCFKDKGIFLPRSLLNRSSLKVLELAIPNCTLNVEAMNLSLNLRTFHLYEIQIWNGNSENDTLILNFPVLQRLQLTKCKWVNVKFVKIYAPVLNTFTSEASDFNGPNDYSIKIIGLMLSTFKSCGGFPDNVILTGSQVVTLSLDNYYEMNKLPHPRLLTEIQLQVSKIMNESSRLNELELSRFMFVGLILGASLPWYEQLQRLSILDPCRTDELFTFIHKAPLLNFVSVNMLDWDDEYDYDAEEFYPSCIKSHLEDVHLCFFEALPCQYEFAKFLLKNCRALKKLTVHHPSWSEKECVKLEYEPRISTSARVVFSLQIEDES